MPKKKTFCKQDKKKRPIRVVYPYMCPFCDELSYPASEKEFSSLRLPEETLCTYKCMAGHTFYVQERVVRDQAWADERRNNPTLVRRSKDWKRQLRDNKYGVEEL